MPEMDGYTTCRTFREFEKAVEERVPRNLAGEAHSLKGTSLTLGLDSLGELAGKLEELGDENGLEEAGKLLDFLEAAASQTMEKIRRDFLCRE